MYRFLVVLGAVSAAAGYTKYTQVGGPQPLQFGPQQLQLGGPQQLQLGGLQPQIGAPQLHLRGPQQFQQGGPQQLQLGGPQQIQLQLGGLQPQIGGPQLQLGVPQPQIGRPQVYVPQFAPQLVGGEAVNKDFFERGQKGQNDVQFETQNGQEGEQFQQNANAITQGQAAARNLRGDSGFLSNDNARRGLAQNGLQFGGEQRRTQEGQNASRQKVDQGRKRGRVVKGFRNSLRKDEDGRNEEYFDEQHDEGLNFNQNEQFGNFGDRQAAAVNGRQQNGEFRANVANQRQLSDNQQFQDSRNANGDQFGLRKFGGKNANFASNSGEGEQSAAGYAQGSRLQKSKPYVH